MKNLLIALLALSLLYACDQTPSYTISGTTMQPELEGKQLFLLKRTETGLVYLDTSVVLKGCYEFKGTATQPEEVWIEIPGETREPLLRTTVFIENGKIAVNTDADGKSRIAGTPNNDLYQQYMDKRSADDEARSKIFQEIRKLREEDALTPAKSDSLYALHNKYSNNLLQINLNFVKTHINTPVGHGQLIMLMRLPLEQQKEAIANVNEESMKVPAVARFVNHVNTLDKTSAGHPYTDLRMPDTDGKEIALSDYIGKGKYVLIDFWASWCVPCCEEMPHLVAAYKKYKGKGLEIIGVSFDTKKEAWLNGIKRLDITWPQMSDLKGIGCAANELYALNGIPHTVLIDPTGTIIARGLRGDELDKQLAEVMK